MDSSGVPLAPSPPSLSGFLWGVHLFSALDGPRGDHTLEDSQQSVVHHERAPSQELERRQVSHNALYKASSTVRSLLSVHTLLQVSSSRTRSSSRSSPMCWSCGLSVVVLLLSSLLVVLSSLRSCSRSLSQVVSHLLRYSYYFDRGQQDFGCKPRKFPAALTLGACLPHRRSMSKECSRKTPSHTLSCFRVPVASPPVTVSEEDFGIRRLSPGLMLPYTSSSYISQVMYNVGIQVG